MKTHQQHTRTWAVVLCAVTLGLWLLGLAAGSRGFEFDLAWTDPIVQDIRLPRTLGAWLAGALLGLAGALAQGLFRNPLADPYLLGSASGAALGVALTLALGAWGAVQATAAGVGMALGGLVRDGVALGSNSFMGYSVVYALEILLLILTLWAMAPLIRPASGPVRPPLKSA